MCRDVDTMLKSVLFRASLNCLVFTLANADFNCRGKSVGYYAETLDDCRTFYVCDDHGRFMTKEFKKAYEKTLDTSIKNVLPVFIFHLYVWAAKMVFYVKTVSAKAVVACT